MKILSHQERETIYLSLIMRKCYIETGDPCVSSADAINMGLKIKPLGIDQMKLLIRIDELMRLFL